MTDIATRSTTSPTSAVTDVLQTVALAGDLLAAAKRSQSTDRIERAERRLQVAVDAARDQRIEWGQIGLALGIARGNAYQRYRRRPDRGRYPNG